MSTIKYALKQRVLIMEYVKKYIVSNNNIQITLKMNIEDVIREGVLIIEKIDSMFWKDSEFIDRIKKFLRSCEKTIKQIEDQVGTSLVGELFYYMELQREIFEAIMKKEIVDNQELKVVLSARRFPMLVNTETNRSHYN